MLIKKIIVGALLVFLSMPVLGQTPQSAEAYYKAGDYQAAQSLYETQTQQQPHRAELWFNLGNTYYRLGYKGKAIWAYLKARQLQPRDKELNANLALVRSQVVGSSDRHTLNKLTLPEWSFIVLICLTLLNTLVISKRKGWLKGELVHNLFYCLAVITFMFSLAWGYTCYQTFYIVRGVAITNEIEVKSGPDSGMSRLFVMSEGTEVRVLEKTTGWIKIQLQNGYAGWVTVSDIGLL